VALPRSSDLKRLTKKSDCALASASESRDSTSNGTWLNNFRVIDPTDPQLRQGGGILCMGHPSADCADFAHCIGEIGESANLLGSFSQSVQKLHRHTFSSAE